MTFRALTLRQSDWRNFGLFVLKKMEFRYWKDYGEEKKRNKLVKWKALVDTVGIESADLEDKFLF